MNWETSKTWLIIVFFVLDLLLGWQFIQSRQATHGYIESQADILANTKTLLAENHFSLQTNIPTNQPDLASIQAKPYSVRLKTLVKDVFPGSAILSVDAHIEKIRTSGGKIRISRPGVWTVTYNTAKPVASVQDALNLIWKGSSYTLDKSLTDGQKVWIYNQNYQGLPLFDASLTMHKSSKGVETYRQKLYSSPQPVGSPKPIISALEALNSLANTVDKSAEPQDNVIEEIDLGYALKSPSAVTNESVSSNYWFPVWRIMTLNTTYYVNAFSGEVETQ